MFSMLRINFPEIFLAVLLFIYVWSRVRAGRMNAQIGVCWILGLAVLLILCLMERFRLGDYILRRVGRDLPLLGIVILCVAWMGFLILKCQEKIYALTVKVKLLDQELALMSERQQHQIGEQVTPVQGTPSVLQAAAVMSPAAPLKRVSTAKKSISQQIASCFWIVAVVYAFGIFSGDISAQATFGETLLSFFGTLQAGYLH